MQAFQERAGHANVPYGHVEDGEQLGVWLGTQRTRYKARGLSEAERKVSALSDEDVERLEALGVMWDVLTEQWERMFGLLQAFQEREGHANVPYGHVEDGEQLGVWLGTQRTRYKARGLSEGARAERGGA
uniref:Helicase-associated domain-containing protein n=1 Tax=Emiliania huxleyi TaxID=2903 RepID=A0A7S3W2U3_EMIHU